MQAKIENIITTFEKLISHIKEENKLTKSEITNLILDGGQDIREIKKNALELIRDGLKSKSTCETQMELLKYYGVDKKETELKVYRDYQSTIKLCKHYMSVNKELSNKVSILESQLDMLKREQMNGF